MKNTITVIALLVLSVNYSFANPPVEEGKAIFTTRCAGCHNVNKTLTGPPLAGIDERRSLAWIINFVQSSQGLIKKGDKEAIALYEKFNKIPMPDHADLDDNKIKSIVEYIKSESKTNTTAAAPVNKPGKLRPNYTPLSINNYGFFITLFGLTILLVAALIALVKVKSLQRDLRKE